MVLLRLFFIFSCSSLLCPGTEATVGRSRCGHIIGPMGEIINLVPQTSNLRPARFTGGSHVCTVPAPTKKTRCKEYNGTGLNPVRPIKPHWHGDEHQFYVYCGVDGEIIIQRREELSLNFNRTLDEYLHGFGNLHGDHWLGLNKVLRILGGERAWYKILVHFEDGEVLKATFRGRLNESLQGSFFKFKGNYIPEMTPSHARKGEAFSARGRVILIANVSSRNDVNHRYCAEACGAGWWYDSTKFCKNNINGILKPDHGRECSSWEKAVTKTQMILRFDKED